jgi:hypothetical protein
MFMLLRVKVHPGFLLGVDLCATTILPLHFAAEEAWMSIETLQRTRPLLRFWVKLKVFVWGLAAEG